MKFEQFIARRYLFGGKRRGSMSAVAFISVAGVALGVFALIVVIAVMDGFDKNLEEKLIGSDAHIVINTGLPAPLIASDELLERIRKVPGVREAAPVIQRLALLVHTDEEQGQQRQGGVFLLGIDLDREPKVTAIMSKVAGNSRPGNAEIVIGKTIAETQLDTTVGQSLLLMAPSMAETPDGGVPLIRNVVMAGTFETGYPQADGGMAYTTLEAARKLFRLEPNQIDAIRVSVSDPDRVAEVTKSLRLELGHGLAVSSWAERNSMLFTAIMAEKWALFVILLLVVLVAAFNIIGTLTMVVLEKTREIGILKSMGASEGRILVVFLNQGLAIGGSGVIIGAVSGLATCYILHNWIRLPGVTAAYFSDRIPVLVTPMMVILTVVCALVIVLLASLLPARQAARLDPVEALRYE